MAYDRDLVNTGVVARSAVEETPNPVTLADVKELGVATFHRVAQSAENVEPRSL